VQAASGIANSRHELTFYERMHVFVVAIHPRRIAAAFVEHLGEGVGDGLGVARIQDAGARQCLCPCQASGHVIFKETSIERE
jgi:hypothetical protein